MAEKVDDLKLPTAVIGRIIKDILPEGVSVSKEARSAVARAASVFVLYLTSSSNNVAGKAKRKAINGKDVLEAINITEFDSYLVPLQEAWEDFKKMQADKSSRKGQEAQSSSAVNGSVQEEEDSGGEESQEELEEEED